MSPTRKRIEHRTDLRRTDFNTENGRNRLMTPQAIRALKQDRLLELVWPGGETSRIAFKTLREQCPCAVCVDEFTGERLLDPATVSPEIVPIGMSFVGNYALKVSWSDDHSTGLFTWDQLREISQSGEIRRPARTAPPT